MKKYLFLAIALLGMASCTNDDIADGNKPIHGGEVETSYIAINLNAANNTRAAGDTYQDGLAAERAVKSAYFFFFKNDGTAFPVTGSPATAPGGTVNWISANLQDLGQGENPNVSDIKDAVLVLSTYVGDYPSQIVAVLNWAPVTGKAYNLDDLYDATNIQGVDSGFVMSNAVYSDGTNAVVGTPLTVTNIFKSPADALANPITIYVERIAAKVTVTAKDDVEENRFQVKKNNNNVSVTIGSSNIDVYVKVEGWELHNDFTQSKLLKEIHPAEWTDLGFTWNDAPYYRCYWATSLTGWAAGENAFPTTFSRALGKQSNVNDDKYTNNTYTYVGENTLYDTTNNGSTANCTKVILKAQLQQKDGEVFKPLALARWYTTYYAGTEDLLKAVANTIKYQYCWKEGDKYTYISYEDLTVKKDGNLVKFQLSLTGESRDWYIVDNSNSTNPYTSQTDDEMNTLLGGLEKALYYEDGYTLYYIDIAHLGNLGNNIPEAGDYGVVRNHIYNVVLNSFGGFGSPVYVPDGNLEYPEDPTDVKDYVSAEVRILSWRLVSQEVDVQP
ncbi:MAG: Mfa1 fimbrilin C-terminal domain-containing protein [Alistipes sp.]|nr:Mfa1 fimbrilin C-terminal domain-containing protein [Alistipes sp.]